MNDLTVVSGVDDAAAEGLIENLQAFNDSHHPLIAARRLQPNDPAPLHVFAKDVRGVVVGGILAKAWVTWKWLEVEIVWVDEVYRGQGLGSMLLDEIEQVGRGLGCTRARLSTWSFQAPGFYLRRGYQIYGELPDFPEGVTDYRLWKPL
ncbi:MAG: GNAT family N-acetyltransferase [Fimbriimonas sp.]|nr:GNAT family N-acetyltransferase [Fimbriimonas sp.]